MTSRNSVGFSRCTYIYVFSSISSEGRGTLTELLIFVVVFLLLYFLIHHFTVFFFFFSLLLTPFVLYISYIFM